MAIDSRDKRFSILGLAGMRIFPTPDGSIDAPDRLQWLGLYRGIAASAIVWSALGGVFNYVSANYGTQSFYFEAYIKATSGTAYSRLYDTTADGAVTDSEVSTASATLVRLRSGALTLADGSDHVMQVGAVASDAGVANGGKVVVI